MLIVALSYTYNYSGMAYTLGAALAGLEARRHLRIGIPLENGRPNATAGEGDRRNQCSRTATDEGDVRRSFHPVCRDAR